MKHSFLILFERLFVFGFALLFMQLPLFILQYQHELKGHVNELKWQVTSMREIAKLSEKNLDDYILKFQSHSDSDFSRQGDVMKKVQTRFKRLSKALYRLEQASFFTKGWYFVLGFEKEIFRSTWRSFEPGIAFSMGGIFYGVIGLLVGYLSFLSLTTLFRRR